MKKINDVQKGQNHLLTHRVSVIITAPYLDHADLFLKSIRLLFEKYTYLKRIIIFAEKQKIMCEWLPLIHQNPDLVLYSYIPAIGRKRNKIKAFSTDRKVILTNNECLEWMQEIKINTGDMIIIDELSNYRKYNSARYRIMSKLCSSAGYIAAFSKLPFPNGLSEIWEEFYLIDKGARLGRVKNAFLDRYFFVSHIWTGGHIKTYLEAKEGAVQAIQRAINDVFLDLSEGSEEDSLPIIRNVFVELSKNELSKYQLIEREHFPVFQNINIDFSNTYSVSRKLLQLASGTVYDDNREVIVFHERKISALKILLDEFSQQNVLIVYWFKHELEHIQDKIPNTVLISDKDSVQRWNEGKIRIGLINSSKGGKYGDLCMGGNVIIWFSLTWSLGLYTKTNSRINRGDGKRPCIIHIVTRNTIDETILKSIEEKRKNNRLMLKKNEKEGSGVYET